MSAPTLDDAIAAVKRLTLDRQQELAGYILDWASDASPNDEPQEIDPAHLTAVLEGLEQAKRGQFASLERVAAAYRRFEK